LQGTPSFNRSQALTALGKMSRAGAKAAVPALIQLLGEPDASNRSRAASQLDSRDRVPLIAA